MKLLFMHNAIPEYRIPWFKKISEQCDVYFLFTNQKIIKRQYHFDTDLSDIANLNYGLVGSGIHAVKNIGRLIRKINEFDFIMLPPCDSPFDFFIWFMVSLLSKKKSNTFFLFLGKVGGAKGKTRSEKKIN